MVNVIDLGHERELRIDPVRNLAKEIAITPKMRENLDWFLVHYYGHVDPLVRVQGCLPVVTRQRYEEHLVYPTEVCTGLDPEAGDILCVREVQQSQAWRENMRDNPRPYQYNPEKMFEAGKNYCVVTYNIRTGDHGQAGVVDFDEAKLANDCRGLRLTVVPQSEVRMLLCQPFVSLEMERFPRLDIMSYADGRVETKWVRGPKLMPLEPLLRECYPDRFMEQQLAAQRYTHRAS